MMDRLQLMVQAALLEDARGQTAWQTWKAHAAGTLTPEEQQIAPTLARALVRRGVTGAEAEALRPYARAAWLGNQANRGVAADALRRLHAAGIETLVLKGMALVPEYYGDPGARRAGDVDILVREPALLDAWNRLTASGWRPVYGDPRHFDPRFSHAVQLVDDAGRSLDLHCHVLAISCGHGADDVFWGVAVPIVVGGVSTGTLNATDQLLHVCVHGQIPAAVAPVRWFSDACMILNVAGHRIDWTRLVAMAQVHRVSLFLAAALERLSEVLGVSIPRHVTDELRAVRVNAIDRMIFRSMHIDSWGRPLLRAQWHAARFLRGTTGIGFRARLRLLPGFLRGWLLVDSWSGVVRSLLHRSARAVAVRAGLLSRDGVRRGWLDLYRARVR